jgi:exonuclease III
MAEAWQWLNDESDADVLLLQETKWPELLSERWLTHSFNRKYEGKGGKWGTAVLCGPLASAKVLLVTPDDVGAAVSFDC